MDWCKTRKRIRRFACSTVSADPNIELLAAIRSGEVAEVTMILEGGADVNTCNRDGLTALCIAAKKVNRKGGLGSHADIVRFLLKQGGSSPPRCR